MEKAYNMNITSSEQLEVWIKDEYFLISGKVMTDKEDDFAMIKQFAHGGMSSGCVSGNWWIKTGIPLLQSRLQD